MKNETWRLYAAPTRSDTMKTALNEAYAKASGTHILIYKRGKCPTGFKEVKGDKLELLPTADRDWLIEINLEVTKMFLLAHEEEEQRAGMKFLEEFERELGVEREKLANQRSVAE